MNYKFNTVSFLFVALISPFLAILVAIRYNTLRFYKIIFPLFYAFVGFTFQIRGGSDATRAKELFDQVKSKNFSDFSDLLILKLKNFSSEGVEIFQSIFSFIFSRINDNYNLTFAFYGFLAGIFLYKIIFELIKINLKNSNIIIFFIIGNLMPICVLNGRFWLATIIFIYFIIVYFNKNLNLKYLLCAGIVIFIHQGYFFGFIFLVLWHFINKLKIKRLIVYIIFTISLFFSTDFAVNYTKNFASNFGGNIERQMLGYVDDNYLEKVQDIESGVNRSFIWGIYNLKNDVLYFSVLFFSVIITFLNKKQTFKFNNFFLLFLFIASLSNFTIGVPNFGSRYREVSAIIGLLYIYKISHLFQILKIRNLDKILYFLLTFVFLVNLRQEMEQMNIFVLFSNVPLMLFHFPDVTVMEFIK